MVAGPFVGSPGENHVCSDWQIVTVPALSPVWTASCVTGTLAVHIHLGDGTFGGVLAGLHQLDADTDYQVRVRFKGDAMPGGEWSPWSERGFHTASASVIEPLVLSDVSNVPRRRRWQDAGGNAIALPPGVAAAPRGSRRRDPARDPRLGRAGNRSSNPGGPLGARSGPRRLHGRSAPLRFPCPRPI